MFIDDLFVNAALLEAGYALIYTKPPNVKYTDVLFNAQQKARFEKKGLWGSYEVVDSSNAASYVNQVRCVRGRIVSTFASKKAVFLNFGANPKTDFTVVIFNNCLYNFTRKNITPHLFYRGKTVEVTGRIKEYNGPEIVICKPEEIRIVEEK